MIHRHSRCQNCQMNPVVTQLMDRLRCLLGHYGNPSMTTSLLFRSPQSDRTPSRSPMLLLLGHSTTLSRYPFVVGRGRPLTRSSLTSAARVPRRMGDYTRHLHVLRHPRRLHRHSGLRLVLQRAHVLRWRGHAKDCVCVCVRERERKSMPSNETMTTNGHQRLNEANRSVAGHLSESAQ